MVFQRKKKWGREGGEKGTILLTILVKSYLYILDTCCMKRRVALWLPGGYFSRPVPLLHLAPIQTSFCCNDLHRGHWDSVSAAREKICHALSRWNLPKLHQSEYQVAATTLESGLRVCSLHHLCIFHSTIYRKLAHFKQTSPNEADQLWRDVSCHSSST